jgi:hypothetical protein
VLEDGGSVEEVVAALPENERHLLVVAAIRFVNQFGPSLADCFLLGKAQPKNALVTPPKFGNKCKHLRECTHIGA